MGEDPDVKHLYNLMVKMIDVPTNQLEYHRDYLQSKGFEIYAIAHNSIEAMLTGDNLQLLEMIRELDREGWIWKESGRVRFKLNR